jgi:putative nucleotidyltransferase with HDIG domain
VSAGRARATERRAGATVRRSGATVRRSRRRVFELTRLTRPQIELLRALVRAVPTGSAPVLVGGAVRDVLLGRPPAVDLDVALPSGALDTGRRLADALGVAFVPLDAERGTARVVAPGHRVDLADFRAPTLAGDLAARDFTVNALAVPLRELLRQGRAAVEDPLGGLADLAARRLRLAGPAVLADDPVRVLRAVRLAVTLDFRLAPATRAAVRRAAPTCTTVSAERVRDEVLALMAAPDTARALRLADRLGVLAAVFPEVEPMRRTTQPEPHRFDVLEHTLRALAACDRLLARLPMLSPFGPELAAHVAEPLGGGIARRQILKLATLLHDVSKPETRRQVRGRVRFFEHDVIGAARARGIGERLRLPERAVAVLERLVRHHLRPMHLGAAGELTARARYRFFRDLGGETRDLVLLVLADSSGVRGESPTGLWRRTPLLRELLSGWEEQRETLEREPLLRGDDVMERFGLSPGPEVGRLLARAREAQALGLVSTREEALAYLDSPRRDS